MANHRKVQGLQIFDLSTDMTVKAFGWPAAGVPSMFFFSCRRLKRRMASV